MSDTTGSGTSRATAQTIRDMADKGTAQAKKSYDKASAAASEAAEVFKDTCSTAAQGAKDYQGKVLEFARANTIAAFDYAEQLMAVKSPAEFVELSTKHAQEQFATLAEQTKELTALAQKVTLESTEPLKAGVTKVFSKVA